MDNELDAMVQHKKQCDAMKKLGVWNADMGRVHLSPEAFKKHFGGQPIMAAWNGNSVCVSALYCHDDEETEFFALL